jgi:hypothetical protein
MYSIVEAIACARRCRSSRLTGWWTQKIIIRKKWKSEEEERHNGLLTLKIRKHFIALNHSIFLERPEASFNFTTRGEILPPWVQLAPGVNFVP